MPMSTPPVYNGPPYISGNLIVPFNNVPLVTGSVATSGEIHFVPFIITQAVTIKALMARVGAVSAGGNFALAIYAHNNATGKPTGLPIASVTGLSTAAATTVEANLATPVSLAPGMYWIGVQRDNNVATFTTVSSSMASVAALVGTATAANALQVGSSSLFLVYVGTYGTLPDMTSATISETLGNRGAVIAFRVN